MVFRRRLIHLECLAEVAAALEREAELGLAGGVGEAVREAAAVREDGLRPLDIAAVFMQLTQQVEGIAGHLVQHHRRYIAFCTGPLRQHGGVRDAQRDGGKPVRLCDRRHRLPELVQQHTEGHAKQHLLHLVAAARHDLGLRRACDEEGVNLLNHHLHRFAVPRLFAASPPPSWRRHAGGSCGAHGLELGRRELCFDGPRRHRPRLCRSAGARQWEGVSVVDLLEVGGLYSRGCATTLRVKGPALPCLVIRTEEAGGAVELCAPAETH
eukprot:scaffold21068_cov66-Phaeocystis_antarctica.AAC.6